VDDYLAWCKERGKQPNKPFSGSFLVRATPELHRGLNMRADADGKSLKNGDIDKQLGESNLEFSHDGTRYHIQIPVDELDQHSALVKDILKQA
jgi:hypothetical protein